MANQAANRPSLPDFEEFGSWNVEMFTLPLRACPNRTLSTGLGADVCPPRLATTTYETLTVPWGTVVSVNVFSPTVSICSKAPVPLKAGAWH
ncbi:MAG: hypothetical protein AB7Q00_01705 [Phycisphaerales bacterium]